MTSSKTRSKLRSRVRNEAGMVEFMQTPVMYHHYE